MKIFSTLVCSTFLLAANLSADPLLPRDVVKHAIQAAREDKLGLFLQLVDVVHIHQQESQPRSPEEIVQLLEKIEEKTIVLDDPRGEWKEGMRIDAHLTSPQKIRFVILCTGIPDGEPRWKIVELHKIK
jgi:hypothetical protein